MNQSDRRNTMKKKKLTSLFPKQNGADEVEEKESKKSAFHKIESAIGVVVMFVYHLRKIIMAIPVVYYALKLAAYNADHLPEDVGLFLQTNGEFLKMIDRNMAVTGPLLITAGCLFLMLFSRKAMYAWAISIFTLALPVLLLISNIYPA